MTLGYRLAPPSVSRLDLVLQVNDTCKIPVELKRHLAPRTVGMMLRSLPIRGNAHRLGGSIVYVGSVVDSGIERARRDFRRGDVAFYPAEGSVCFFVRDASAGRQMSPIGRITSGVDGLANVKPGDVLSLYQDAG